ncbi:hypothetical protein BDZ89DRAFT_1020331 [Hymenopellis radicata]|nr:hypothetical protein BDZ89DRAFT_1020331 [Hymenopellis radicata]
MDPPLHPAPRFYDPKLADDGRVRSCMGTLRRRRSGGVVNVPLSRSQCRRDALHLDSRRALRFDAITRDLKEGDVAVRIGRFADRSNPPTASTTTNKIAFKSKVVSRAHAEVWCEAPGVFYVRDPSSGTFLNHVRLSPANTESRASVLRDGDIPLLCLYDKRFSSRRAHTHSTTNVFDRCWRTTILRLPVRCAERLPTLRRTERLRSLSRRKNTRL